MSDQLKYLKVPLLTACLSEKIMDGEKEKKTQQTFLKLTHRNIVVVTMREIPLQFVPSTFGQRLE